MTSSPTLIWFRRDLRLGDHEALSAAVARGEPVIPVFICDALVDGTGTAPQWRLGLSVEALARDLESRGSRLILRRGEAGPVLSELIRETGAGAVYWSRAYDPAAMARDTQIKADLRERGIEARSFAGHLLFEPWTVATGTGGFYRVYTPMFRAVRPREVPLPLPAPGRLPAPESWPQSEVLADWHLGAGMRRGAEICRPHQIVGEAAARARLDWFVDGVIGRYKTDRDFPAIDATSRLSASLSLGEISPRTCWHAALRAQDTGGAGSEQGIETYLKELVWREFAWHLLYHTPEIASRNWRADWDGFPWLETESAAVLAWKQGRTGEPFVDAAMREMYVTGTMHNRARMIVGSYLTKHLLTHWQIGLRWFEDCLTDWDPASNAMGWQWVAGCGPDAAPYFRIFNPATQLAKFDPKCTYQKRWIAELQPSPPNTALDYFRAVPVSWELSANDCYPERPVVGLAEGRARALAAYEAHRSGNI